MYFKLNWFCRQYSRKLILLMRCNKMVHIINKNYSVVRVLCIVEKYQIYLVNLGSVHQKKPCSAKITSKFLFKIGKFTALLKAL